MHTTFERKMNQVEFKNLTDVLNFYFKTEEEVLRVFTKMMTFGEYTWQDNFKNKVSLVYTKASDVIMKDQQVTLYTERINALINEREGEDKKYFLYRNYHKCPQMWRLDDRKLIWGVGFPSSNKPLQPHYVGLCKQLEDEDKRKTEQEKMSGLKALAASFVL